MPNVLPKGLFGRPDGIGIGAPLPAASVHATLPAATALSTVLQVWASDATGVPILVWSSSASAPTGVTIAWTGQSQVTVTWTPAAAPNLAADRYEVRRPSGAIAGTVTPGTGNTFVDNAPEPVNGAYTVVAMLDTVSAAPVASNTLNLSVAVTSLAAVWTVGTPSYAHVTWVAPAYGMPAQYAIYRNGVFRQYIAGNLLVFDDTSAPRGQSNSYRVHPVLGGTAEGTGATIAVNTPAAEPIVDVWTADTAFPGSLTFQFHSGGGANTGYEVDVYPDPSGPFAAIGAAIDAGSVASGSLRWHTGVGGQIRVRAMSTFGNSAYVTMGTKYPAPPTPTNVDISGAGPGPIVTWDPGSSSPGAAVTQTNYELGLITFTGGPSPGVWVTQLVAPVNSNVGQQGKATSGFTSPPYSARVRAISSKGVYSAYSATASM